MSQHNDTALTVAAFNGHLNVVVVLLGRGSDMEVKNVVSQRLSFPHRSAWVEVLGLKADRDAVCTPRCRVAPASGCGFIRGGTTLGL